MKYPTLLFFLCFSFFCWAQEEVVASKIYLDKEFVTVPLVSNQMAGMVYYASIDSILDSDAKYILMLAISDLFDYQIKYCFFEEQLFALSLWNSSVIIDGRPIGLRPHLIGIPSKQLELVEEPFIKTFLKQYGRTAAYIDFYTNVNHLPIDNYFGEGRREKGYLARKYYHDFASSNNHIYFVFQKEHTLNVWEYDTFSTDSTFNGQKTKGAYIAEYDWNSTENFYTCFINDKLYLFTESGAIYHLGEEAQKIGQLSDNLITSTLVIHKDANSVYLIRKEHLQKQESFAMMVVKYAQPVSLE